VRPPAALPSAISAVVGLTEADLAEASVGVSVGLPFLIIKVRDEEALNRASCDDALWRSTLSGEWAHHLFLYCDGGAGQLAARMFAPAMGIREDPATGAAAAALTAYLALRAPEGDVVRRLTILQGARMGRPSSIETSFEKAGGTIRRIRVGGSVVAMASGTLRLP
jgi:trans-2,3-dihydro-3-hydroxyanthranilate isomerase